MSTKRNTFVCGVTVLLAGGLAGCGSSGASSAGSSNNDSSSTHVSAPSSASSGGGEGSKSAKQVLADAKSALFNAKAVHVTGTVTDGAQHEKLDLQFQGTDSAGTETINGMVLHIVKVGGTAYLKAPSAFWKKTAGPKAAVLAGKWIKSPGTSGNLSSLTLQGLAASIDASDSPLKPGVRHESLQGKKALVLTQGDGSELYVADAKPPVPLRIVNTKSSKGQLDFTDYGKTQHISAPKGAVTAKQAVKDQSSKATT
ncbi:hypothetical protein [Leekyejoonella antrihumi]|uniref:LppX_LprAFG lipoprotein n=1 Tax=Leekyejoonella antrihumi TaxID=1660198 RepID=A0A563E7Y4_9MICO|nr:hypothetical protein [Leekyejoonella antrihumi]TWP37934.1 hypothetical protein FGL98_04285 [Leekyejoonella antrihumi]